MEADPREEDEVDTSGYVAGGSVFFVLLVLCCMWWGRQTYIWYVVRPGAYRDAVDFGFSVVEFTVDAHGRLWMVSAVHTVALRVTK